MALDIPLLEAGTQGFFGQAVLFERGVSNCYDCWPRDTAQTTYPICTIRTFPEKPVHCIVWAKNLFNLLFGPDEEDNPL